MLLLARLGVCWGGLVRAWAAPEAPWHRPGLLLGLTVGRSWPLLGCPGGLLSLSWVVVVGSCGPLRGPWARLGVVWLLLAPAGPLLAGFGPLLDRPGPETRFF